MRKRIFEIIETTSDGDKISTVYDFLMMITIIASLIPLGFKTETEVFKIVDMLHYIVAIAAINKINLSDIILQKDRAASIKYNHEINLETFLLNKQSTLS